MFIYGCFGCFLLSILQNMDMLNMGCPDFCKILAHAESTQKRTFYSIQLPQMIRNNESSRKNVPLRFWQSKWPLRKQCPSSAQGLGLTVCRQKTPNHWPQGAKSEGKGEGTWVKWFPHLGWGWDRMAWDGMGQQSAVSLASVRWVLRRAKPTSRCKGHTRAAVSTWRWC